jgi:uncharacterized membrane protein HdeD (DUF308 family)
MFIWHSQGVYPAGLGLWARYQMFFGILLVLAGVIIVLYPPILAITVAAVIILAGLSMIASGWQMRRAYRHRPPNRFDIDAE